MEHNVIFLASDRPTQLFQDVSGSKLSEDKYAFMSDTHTH